MGAAAAQVAGERLADLGFARRLVRREKRRGRHDHAVDAIAALRGLLVDEGTSRLRWLCACTQPLERARAALELADRKQAREHRLAVQVDGTRAGIPGAAAEARAL